MAKAQNTTSAGLTPPALPVGAGTLRLEVGKWSADRSTFDLAAGKSPVDIDISATDKLSDVASKINGAKAGVTATIVSDASGERLLLRSKATGEESGFRMTVKTDADGDAADTAGLSRLVAGATTEYGANARAKVNGIDVTSSSNVFANTVAGVTFTAVKETTAPITVTVAKDSSAVKANLENFVKAYNAVNQALNQVTAYDKDTQTAGLLQGDTTAVALQNTLRMAIQSVAGGSGNGGLRSLSDVGVMVSKGTGVRPTGDLELDTKKLETALADPDAVKALFRGPDGGSLTDGVAGKIKAATGSLLSGDGFFASKDKLLKKTLDNVQKEITRVEDRADSVEKNLKVRYTALDTQMSRLNALNAYVAQQVTTWNKSSG
ncbi:MAG: flagellar filament capping protein FliD [Macromonas sp.]